MSVQSGPSPPKHRDGRRTAANLVDCLLGDVEALIHNLPLETKRDLENRFHVTLRHDRRLRERFSKLRAREIVRNTQKT